MLVFYILSFLTRRSNRRLPFWLRNVSVETHGRLAEDPAQRSHRSGRYPQTRRIRDRLRVDKCGHARSEESPYSSPKLCAIEEIRQLKSRYFEATATTTRSRARGRDVEVLRAHSDSASRCLVCAKPRPDGMPNPPSYSTWRYL